tara:strand:- start:755 stop:2608 length:1854 start_codon:yes stop_codon:yes gene_type:complete
MTALLEGLRDRAEGARSESVGGMDRIIALPVEHYTPEQSQSNVNAWSYALRVHADARRLRPIQADILDIASRQAAKNWPAGMLGLVGVGAGKTLAFFLLPQVFKAQRPLLLLPADMISGGNVEADWCEWVQEYDLLPMHIIRGGNVPQVPSRTLFVMSYAQLSQPHSSDVLRRIAPDLVLSDECHYLKAADAARTKRFVRYMESAPSTRFVGMSGTMTGTSLKDYWHLAKLALRHESFLPDDDTDLKRWCGVLDADATASRLDRILLDPLTTWAHRQTGKQALSVLAGESEVRQAYNYRMVTCPGTVATTSPSCDARLVLTGKRDIVFAGPDETELPVPDAMRLLREEDTLPNGLVVEDALSKFAAMQQLSMGFYYYWDWPLGPDGEPMVDKEYVGAKRGWDAAVRQYLKSYSREGCDSPFLVDQYVRRAVAEGRRISEDLVYWQEQWDIQKRKPEPPTKAKWLDFSVMIAAMEWSKENDGFLWFRSRAVGEVLQACGIPTFWEGLPSPERHPKAALSLAVYNKGKNFQAWRNQLYLEVPSDAKLWEQSLGRTHRAGQTAPVVRATILQHTWVMRRSWRTSLARAQYIQATTGQLQRLVFADKRCLDEADTFDAEHL